MKIEIKINSDCLEPKLFVITNSMTKELEQAIKLITQSTNLSLLLGYREESIEILDQKDISRVYALNKKIYAERGNLEYQMKQRLYELEDVLDKSFVRISNSEIVNLKHIKKLDLSLSGTICVYLSNGKVTYASRRYVTKIKKILGI